MKIQDGDYSEELECSAYDDATCQCRGAEERAGTYTVTATLRGQKETQTVKVSGDECHVSTEELTFFGDAE